jgi:hypothetical protein
MNHREATIDAHNNQSLLVSVSKTEEARQRIHSLLHLPEALRADNNMKSGVSIPAIGKPNRSSRTTQGTQSNSYVRTENGGMKFIGGAAMARRKATAKPKGNRILRPGEKENQKKGLPAGLSPFERFFAGLLRSETSEFTGKPREAWTTICKRMGLPTPSKPLAASYDSQKVHFAYRAALVLEEARYAVAAGVMKMQKRMEVEAKRNSNNSHRNKKNNHRKDRNSNAMIMTLEAAELKGKTGHSSLCFEKGKAPFTPDEVASLRQGTVFACLNQSLASNVANMYLGCILPASRDDMIKSHSFSVIIFREIKAAPGSVVSSWSILTLRNCDQMMCPTKGSDLQAYKLIFSVGVDANNFTSFRTTKIRSLHFASYCVGSLLVSVVGNERKHAHKVRGRRRGQFSCSGNGQIGPI